jgi:hypothetical protein
MRIVGIALLLALTACEGPSLTDKQKDEAGDIAGDAAVDMIADSGLESRLDDLEARVDELENQALYK